MSQLNSRAGRLGLVLGIFALVVAVSGYNLELGGTNLTDSHEITSVQDDGAEIYMTRCMSCHQMNGGGVPGVFPPLNQSEWVTGSKGRLIRIILNGMTGEIEVKGETYSGAMPPWGSFLDDQQMADLLTYLRTSWGNDASEITAEEVAEVRALVEDRKDPWTQEQLDEVVSAEEGEKDNG